MIYDIKEFWYEKPLTGKVLDTLIHDHSLEAYELFEMETRPKPYNPNLLYINGQGNWHLVRFRRKVG